MRVRTNTNYSKSIASRGREGPRRESATSSFLRATGPRNEEGEGGVCGRREKGPIECNNLRDSGRADYEREGAYSGERKC